MANLKDLKIRIGSVKSTQKITKAMKMVAASKLRRAQERCEAARPYAEKMERMLTALASNITAPENAPRLLIGTGESNTHLLVVMTSDRGLCGAFNGSIVRQVKQRIHRLQEEGKTVKLFIVGKKGADQLKPYEHLFVERLRDISKKQVEYADADTIAAKILALFEEGAFDVCSVMYNRFASAISQEVTSQQLIPLDLEALTAANTEEPANDNASVYEYEPGEEAVLSDLLPRNIAVQLFRSLLESSASEHGARMTAMDNATRNAGEMIKGLTLQYNRTRQAAITTELIEIISGAEAL